MLHHRTCHKNYFQQLQHHAPQQPQSKYKKFRAPKLPKTFQNFLNSSRNSANHSCRNNIKFDTKQISKGIDTASYKKLITPVSIQVAYSPETDNPRRSLAMQITHRLWKELTQAMVKQAIKHRFFHVLSHSLQKPTAENHRRRTQNTKDFNFSSREKMGRSEKAQRWERQGARERRIPVWLAVALVAAAVRETRKWGWVLETLFTLVCRGLSVSRDRYGYRLLLWFLCSKRLERTRGPHQRADAAHSFFSCCCCTQ